MWMPKQFAIIYGAFADTVPIFGSRKKSWLIIMGLLQFTSMMVLALKQFESSLMPIVLITTTMFAFAYMEVLTDALMVVQSKIDPEYGSQ